MPFITTPITLDCACEGSRFSLCSIVALDFVVEDWASHDLQAMIATLVNGPGGSTLTFTASGTTALTPVADWLALLPSLGITLFFGRSLSSDVLGVGTATFYIKATYLCLLPDGTTTTKYKYSHFLGGQEEECPDNGRGIIAGGNLFATWWHSRPLSDCTTITIDAGGGFEPIFPDPVQNTHGQADWCLCAHGGTSFIDSEGNEFGPIYYFTIISGALSSGQVLDPITGCIGGSSDNADPGTDTITFQVLDVRDPAGQTATVTCGVLAEGCTGHDLLPAPNVMI